MAKHKANACLIPFCPCGARAPGPAKRNPRCADCRRPPCEVCGTRFKPTNNKGVRQRTCSRACGVELRRRAGNLSQPQGSCCELHWATCKECGKTFVRSHAGAALSYCGDCYGQHGFYYYAYGRVHRELEPLPIESRCHECGITFRPKRAARQGQPRLKFCTAKCCDVYSETSDA